MSAKVEFRDLRIGEGSDIHALVPGRPLVIGGIRIPHTHGLLGHSDADVLLHAIIDALLGAAALGDIGTFFPDSAAAYKNADSADLLARVVQHIGAAGWRVANLDATVSAQAPKLAPYREAMIATIAETLSIAPTRVNVKAKTGEHLGPVGQRSAIEARAVVLLYR